MQAEAVATNIQPSQASLGLNAAALIRTAILAAFAFLIALAWVRNVNWDEFFYLSQVHAHLNGTLDRPLQTFHVHFFGWLAALPGNEMTQIFAGRLVMTALLAVTASAIWHIARSLTAQRNSGALPAGIAVLAFLSSGYVLAHGASFRTDPVASGLLMAALAILMTARMTALHIAATAVLTALALLVTIKSVLLFPALLGAFVWRADARNTLVRMLFAIALAVAIAGALYVWHASGVLPAAGRDAAATTKNALSTTLLDAGLAPRLSEAVLWLGLSIGPATLALFGMFKAQQTRLRIVLILFALPLVLSILFYRNAFAYFFPFIVPPLMVAVAVGAAHIESHTRRMTFVVLMLVTGGLQAALAFSEDARLQRDTIAEVHRLFPEPVSYIDQNAMISSFPRDLFFMSSWGMARYRAVGQPVMADLIARDAPPFVLATRDGLHRALADPRAAEDVTLLLPADIKALRETYVHHNGPIWLAGKTVTLGEEPQLVDMPIAGTYRIKATSPITADSMVISDGDTLAIDGPLTITGLSGSKVQLIWDTGVAPTATPLSREDQYSGFWQFSF